MEKGYYPIVYLVEPASFVPVAIHNKNGKGLLPINTMIINYHTNSRSQSTIKMEKGYYTLISRKSLCYHQSQSTIKMEKGYYVLTVTLQKTLQA